MTSLNLPSYNISSSNGFLADQPLTSFSNTYYQPWDEIITKLSTLISSKRLCHAVERLETLNTDFLTFDSEYQRAYVVLGFIIHGYIWSNNPPRTEIPPQLSEPFLQVCEYLKTEPVLSYSGLCIWNWSSADDGSPHDLETIRSLASFTGTRGEDAFYHVPVLVEAEGGKIIPLILDAMSQEDPGPIIEALHATSEALARMSNHLAKLYSTLDANFFYNVLRPFLAGGSNLPDGITFRLADKTSRQAKCIGGSAAQSSLFPFLDIVLGVKHSDTAFFQEMRAYMPGKHRKFLEVVSDVPSIESYVQAHPGNNALRCAYDECLKQLQSWRGKHIAVVSKYIVQPARAEGNADSELQGTGGSALIPFLRLSKDETVPKRN